ncbi:MAG: Smr/MutS family protein [Deltaproteobacteria bacterium]|nr:Smr/MutS family protein [Deltaproteobacteria bacterium]
MPLRRSHDAGCGGCILFQAAGMEQSEQPYSLPIDGVLDLHTFQPADCKNLVPEYLAECRKKGILQVRIIHGKGRGVLRQTVHHVLGRLPEVIDFHQAPDNAGGWGATSVILESLPLPCFKD